MKERKTTIRRSNNGTHRSVSISIVGKFDDGKPRYGGMPSLRCCHISDCLALQNMEKEVSAVLFKDDQSELLQLGQDRKNFLVGKIDAK